MKEHEHNTEPSAFSAAEPPAGYGFSVRKMSREELERDYITLEELDRRLSATIHSHFHPDE